jgi:predicted  nucleic acid-binding Zn-ribbon protein
VSADFPPAGSSGALDTLLQVQALDTTIAQLLHKRATLPDRVRLATLAREQGEVAARTEESRAGQVAITARLDELASQDDLIGTRLAEIEARLYAARGTSVRDLQAMDDEVRHLRHRRSGVEDAEIEAMLELEPVDAELDALLTDQARLADEAARLRDSLGGAEAVLNGELASVRTEREELATRLPEDLAAQYESLRSKLGGIGAAALVGNRCQGCHLELPAAAVDRIRRSPDGVIVTCEQCGRILVRTSQPR